MKILILGHTGMLGHMVELNLEAYYKIETTDHRWPSKEFKKVIKESDADYTINCVGSIPQRTKDFSINTDLPIYLDQNFQGKIIHPGTDCEMDDDDYGTSKRKASDWIKEKGTRTKILKTSIIGPELNSSVSLLEWFLNSEGKVGGYTKAMWSGITTLEWAIQADKLTKLWDEYKTETILEGECLSKFDLLNMFKDVFEKEITIEPNDKVTINKCLTGDIKIRPLKGQLELLKVYYYDSRS